jgi:N-terminal domain of molybdenum-binding protein
MLAIKPRSFSIRIGDREVEIGSKVIEILRIVKMRGTLKAASKELGISYRGVLSIVRKLEKELGERLIETRRGRGARARLTRLGEEILDIYLSTKMEEMSFRNKIPAKVISIERDGMSAIVTVETSPSIVKALITSEALDELGLKIGDYVNLVIKASNIALIK